MSGHSGYVSAGNRSPVVNQPRIGGVDNHANPPANGPVVPQQGQPGNHVQANPPNARSLAQKLDVMLMEAARLSTKSVDKKTIQNL